MEAVTIGSIIGWAASLTGVVASSFIGLLLYIYKKDNNDLHIKVKVNESSIKELSSETKSNTKDLSVEVGDKLSNSHKAVDERFEDVYSDLDRLQTLPERVASNEKDIEWLKKANEKS